MLGAKLLTSVVRCQHKARQAERQEATRVPSGDPRNWRSDAEYQRSGTSLKSPRQVLFSLQCRRPSIPEPRPSSSIRCINPILSLYCHMAWVTPSSSGKDTVMVSKGPSYSRITSFELIASITILFPNKVMSEILKARISAAAPLAACRSF